MVRGIPHEACDEEKLNDYFRFVENQTEPIELISIFVEKHIHHSISHI
jgi:hypothetical protein